MKPKRDIKLKTYDDIFNVVESLPESDIKDIDIDKLVDFRDHPYKVTENKDMEELLLSIQQNGVLVPVLVRPVGDKYEIISGHRRKFCAQKSGFKQIPCVIKDMSYDEAVLIMVDSNIQRRNLLPSEKALSYKMKLNAIKRQGERTDLTSRPTGIKSAEIVGSINNESQRNVYRYVRLSELNPSLLNAVDLRKLSLRAAVDLSYLSKEEQSIIEGISKGLNRYPTMEQAAALKENAGDLTEDSVCEIMLWGNEKDSGVNSDRFTLLAGLNERKLMKYFPKHFSLRDIEDAIVEMLEGRRKGE